MARAKHVEQLASWHIEQMQAATSVEQLDTAPCICSTAARVLHIACLSAQLS